MEFLDVVDEQGRPTGEVVERTFAHAAGVRHRTAHVWIFRRHKGQLQVLLQKRSADKDSHPGCYDISSAGHIPAGSEVVPSALRELGEELGVAIPAAALHHCGRRSFAWQGCFYGKPFHDVQVSEVFWLALDRQETDFTPQKEEVMAVHWFDAAKALAAVQGGSICSCIYPEELAMATAAAEQAL